jgi:hypothetical protein
VVQYEAASGLASFHHPLHHFISCLFAALLSSPSQFTVGHLLMDPQQRSLDIELDELWRIFEHPVRVQVKNTISCERLFDNHFDQCILFIYFIYLLGVCRRCVPKFYLDPTCSTQQSTQSVCFTNRLTSMESSMIFSSFRFFPQSPNNFPHFQML